MTNFRKVGDGYEDIVVEIAKSHGMQILSKNFRTRYAEIDIIVKDGDTIAFVEVKYRSSNISGNGFNAVNITKQKHISKCALAYISKEHLPLDNKYRFDVVAISKNKYKWMKNAFDFRIR